MRTYTKYISLFFVALYKFDCSKFVMKIENDMYTLSVDILAIVLTVVTIIIALIDHEKVKRLSKYGYLDRFKKSNKTCLYVGLFNIILHYIYKILEFINFQYIKIFVCLYLCSFVVMFISLILISYDIMWLMKIVFKTD